jgi:hypothetical protein
VTSLQKKCEEYQVAIAESRASVIVIGCGDAKNLANYRKETGFMGPLYSGVYEIDSTACFTCLVSYHIAQCVVLRFGFGFGFESIVVIG